MVSSTAIPNVVAAIIKVAKSRYIPNNPITAPAMIIGNTLGIRAIIPYLNDRSNTKKQMVINNREMAKDDDKPCNT